MAKHWDVKGTGGMVVLDPAVMGGMPGKGVDVAAHALNTLENFPTIWQTGALYVGRHE